MLIDNYNTTIIQNTLKIMQITLIQKKFKKVQKGFPIKG